MEELLSSLFSNPKFPLYLGLIIAVLLASFCVVFFFGKKDQKKLEQTQKLEKIDANAFSEVSAPVDITVAKPIEEPKENKPVVNAAPEIPLPQVTEEVKETVSSPASASKEEINKENQITEEIAKTKVAEPENVEVPNFTSLTSSIEDELRQLEQFEKSLNNKENKSKRTDIYSSVYIPEKETDLDFEETTTIELPKLK